MQRTQKEFIEWLHQFIGTAKGERFDKAAVIYHAILETDDQCGAFAYFLDNADYIESTESAEVEPYFTAQQLEKLANQFEELLDGILIKLISQHQDKEKFYSELWKYLLDSDLIFETEKEKIYALYSVWVDGRIPYFQIENGLKMPDNEFFKTFKETEKLIREALFILSCKVEQKTEYASNLLRVLDKCKNEKERAVVLTYILEFVDR